jgi:hypothetical protein
VIEWPSSSDIGTLVVSGGFAAAILFLTTRLAPPELVIVTTNSPRATRGAREPVGGIKDDAEDGLSPAMAHNGGI